VKDHANVVVTRTFSKGYSLAGLRFGYAIAQPQVIQEMMKVKDSYNCDALSIIAATAAILDQDHARAGWQHVREERQRVSSELTKLDWLVLPSHANFILAVAPDGQGRAAYLGLKAQGILVRYFDKPGLTDKIRITIGTSQENNALIGGIKAMTAAEKAA
jgi:histidinol-phosphate aminotransferase